jgi:hypothetical protein
MIGKLILTNITDKDLAYYVWSSTPVSHDIEDRQGFIDPNMQKVVTINLHSVNPDDCDQGLYFVKCLPLKDGYLDERKEIPVDGLFHIHNILLLFSVAQIPGTFDLTQQTSLVNQQNMSLQ